MLKERARPKTFGETYWLFGEFYQIWHGRGLIGKIGLGKEQTRKGSDRFYFSVDLETDPTAEQKGFKKKSFKGVLIKYVTNDPMVIVSSARIEGNEILDVIKALYPEKNLAPLTAEEIQLREQLCGIDTATIIASPRKFAFATGKDGVTVYQYNNLKASGFVAEAGIIPCGGDQPLLSWTTLDMIIENIAVSIGRRKINLDLLKRVYEEVSIMNPEVSKQWVLGPDVRIDDKTGEVQQNDYDMGIWDKFENKGVEIID